MENRRFLVVISCITFVFCGLITAYSFATEPPFGANATAAVFSADSGPSPSAGSDSSFDALFVSEPSGGAAGSAAANHASSVSAAAPSAVSSARQSAAGAVSSHLTTSRKTASKAASSAVDFPVDINTANAAALDALPGIGPVLAQRIVDYRTQNGAFKTTEELKNVKGIGDKIFAKLSADVTVG